MFFSLCRQFIIIIALLSQFYNISSFGQSPYQLSDPDIVHRLDNHVEFFVDDSDTISFEQVSAQEFQSRFELHNGDLTFGYLKSSIWLKVNLTAASPETNWYLEIPAPFLEYVDFYQLSAEGVWSQTQAGYYRPHSVRDISHTSHILSLQFNADLESMVYIRIGGLSPKTFPLIAIEKEKFHEKVRLDDLGYGIFFGILIVMFFYNLFIYLTLRQGNYLIYICTIVCTFLIFSSASGYAGKFLWPSNPTLNYFAGRLSLGVLVVFLTIFTIRFLDVRTYSKAMYYGLVALIPLALAALTLVVTGILPSAGNNLISLSTVMYMTTGVVCRIKGNKTANYFIAAWTIYLIGGLLLTLRNSGVLNFNFWTTHFVEIGAALETVIIAFALGDHYRRLRREKEEAQLMALRVQREATERLETKVKERTEELSRANEELQATLETNKHQTRIIENKNAELDAFFYRISHDLKGPISSLLGLSVLAKMEISDERARGYIDKQHSQVDRLNNIITGLINLTQLNHADLHRQRIDFHKMIDDCIASFNGLPNFRNMTFRKSVDDEIEFYSEWTLLNAVVQNLIENAIKYSRGETPYVQIRILRDTGWIVIEVEDNGQGIPGEYQSKIFEMFYRATHNANGSGLGLYILKRSVDRLKGTIDIKSVVGVGSTFTVKLPHVLGTE